MIYEEYEAIWSKIRKLEKELFNQINKRETLFDKTQPKSPKLDKEKVDGKNPTNMMDQYVIQKEYLNTRIEQLNITLDDWYQALKRKREELRLSKNLYDMIYYYRYIERLSIFKVSKLVNYSDKQTRRHLKNIEKTLKCPKMSIK